jgi:transposase-like protein
MENTNQSVASHSTGKRGKGYPISKDLKSQILKRIKEEGISVSQAAEEHGINPRTIYQWLGKGITGQPTWSEVAKLKKRISMLTELVGEITIKLSQTKKKS